MPPCRDAEADRWPRWPAPGRAADESRSLKLTSSPGPPRLPDAPVRCSPEPRSSERCSPDAPDPRRPGRRSPGAPVPGRPEPRAPGAPVPGRPEPRAPGAPGAPDLCHPEPRAAESRPPGTPAGLALPPLPEPGRSRAAPRSPEPVRGCAEPRSADSAPRRAVPRPADSEACPAEGVSGSSVRSLQQSPGESPESARRFGRPLADPARSGRPPALPATSNLHQSQLKPSGPLLTPDETTQHSGLCPLSRFDERRPVRRPPRRPSQAGVRNALRAVTLR